MRKILSFLAAALFFVGCQENMLEETYAPKYSAPLIISVDNSTRSFNEELKWSWEENDHLVGYQNAGEKMRNTLTLENGNDFVCNNFEYSSQEAADFHFFYAQEDGDHALTAYQDGTWRPVYVGTASATTLDAIDRVELSHLSSALEVRVWQGDKDNHTERKVTQATLSSDNDFVGKWCVADDLTYTQSYEGKEIRLTGLDTSTVVFNMPVNEEGFAADEFTLHLKYGNTTYSYSLPALTFEAGKRTIMNIIIQTSVSLPKGTTINNLIPDEATSVKFVVNSNEKSDVNLGSAYNPDASIYLVVKNDTEVEFHTPADKIMANSDCSQMFYQKNQLVSIDLTNLDTSNVTNMSSMFESCSGLKSLNVSNFNTSNVTDMSQIFAFCSGLKTLDLNNFDTSKVTTMASMFHNCTGLTSLDVSNFNTSKVTTMLSMFYKCAGLTSLDLSNFNTSEVTDMSSMLESCSGLKTLDLNNFDTSKVTTMSSMFSSSTGLTSLDLSNFNTSKVTTMAFMFDNCTGLTSLDLRSFNFSKATLPNNKKYMFRDVGNDYSPNPITITITKGRNFIETSLGRGNYEIVYVD